MSLKIDVNRKLSLSAEISTDSFRRAGNLGKWVIIVAAVLWSTNGFFAKAPILTSWDADIRGPVVAFWRALFATLVLLPFARQIRFHWKLIPATLVFVAMNVTYLTAMAKTTAANAIWLQNTSPTFVFLFSIFVLRETAKRRDWVMVALGSLGVGTILVFELSTAKTNEGVYWGLGSGLTLAGVVISLRSLRDFNSIWLIAIYHLVTAVLLAPYALSKPLPTSEQSLWLIAFGVLQMGVPYVLFAWGLRHVLSHEAAFLILLEPILVPVWVWIAWRNDPSYQFPNWWTFVGAAFILAGLVVKFGKVPERAKFA